MQEPKIDIAEILKQADFKVKLSNLLDEVISKRVRRPEPKEGYRYKRDWHDRMCEKQQINATFFLDNIEEIWTKKSNLNAETRSVILYVCNKALEEYLLEKQIIKPSTL